LPRDPAELARGTIPDKISTVIENSLFLCGLRSLINVRPGDFMRRRRLSLWVDDRRVNTTHLTRLRGGSRLASPFSPPRLRFSAALSTPIQI
jgi:hypothetical protein